MEVGQPPPYETVLPRRGDEFCKADPTPLHSPSIWELKNAKIFLDYPLPRLHLQLAVIFILTQSLYILLKRFHLSRIVSEILAGIILGPTILGAIFPNFTKTLFPAEGYIYMELLGKIGFVFFIFLIGVKMDPTLVVKTGKKAWTIGVASVVIPIAIGLTFSQLLEIFVGFNKIPAVKSVIATQTLTPFPVIVCLLIDLNIMNSELGRLALASALIRELLSTAISTLLTYVKYSVQVNFWLGLQTLALCLVFVFTVVLVGRPVLLWNIRQTPEGKPVKGVYVAFISFAVLLSAIITEHLGLQYQFGPFILGLTVPDGPPLGATLVERLDSFISGLFAPVLITYCGMRTDLLLVYNLKLMAKLWIIIFVSAVVKFAANFFPALVCKLPVRDALALALIMCSQGIVELASFLTHMENMTLDEDTFSAAIFSVLLTAVVIPLLVRSIYDYSTTYAGYQKRNILYSTGNAEFRILACAHRQDDALAAIKLLEASGPTRESPVTVSALHLVELVGRASPIFINHTLGQKASTASSRSQQIIDIFNYYQQKHLGSVNVQAFTAISMPQFMHHDICSLAFDRLVSLILLPFHRKWNSQGKMILDSNALRTINHNVLDMAPCSVGILIDRRKIIQLSPTSSLLLYRVAVIFLGGDDDREALAYAKRMANLSSGVHITVIRFVALEDRSEDSWEKMLDTEVLNDIRVHFCSTKAGNVVYREEKMKDGPETALRIHAMRKDYDLIMVGRRHRRNSPLVSGLTEWNEFPELGEIGDLLASADENLPVSVLVVQQQHMKIK
uniref:Putative cation/H(+) antiporter 3-like n=1 Tax=Davidia involucrata TaxID=16924 RepID=A0A5B6Z9M8_DAVIN